MGGAAVHACLKEIDLEEQSIKLRSELPITKNVIEFDALVKKLRLVEQFLASGAEPAWMVLTVLPVLPPELRPIVELGNMLVTADLNDLYRRVICRNNRTSDTVRCRMPFPVTDMDKKLLQEAVDNLIDNNKSGRKAIDQNDKRLLRSLSETIKGKQGRFRQNLLGKRVDFSGRSVIISGPALSMGSCGLPIRMAMKLFEPYIIHKLVSEGHAGNILIAQTMLNTRYISTCKILEEVVEQYPVILNRAPTLHCFGIQGFYPRLIEGNAIQLHSSVCPGFNADFDGDHMAVHIPLCLEAQYEVRASMLPGRTFLSPATAYPILTHTQDMVLGVYQMTSASFGQSNSKQHYFSSFQDVVDAFECEEIALNTFCWVRFGGFMVSPGGTKKK